MSDSSWQQHEVGSPLRIYQRSAVKKLLPRLAETNQRVCLVAPPGSGKTRMAIHVAASLRVPLEVRVPTGALVKQWQQRLAENVVAIREGERPHMRVSTYAGLGEFKAGALVILDEAHHLVANWGEAVEAALGEGHRVLGLTATPPWGNRGWDLFVAVVGLDPVVVEAAPLVRDGHLCPYRDLVWPVLADPDDAPALAQAGQALADLESDLAPALDPWVAWQLREKLLELTEDRFVRQEGLLVALCRRRHALGRELPNDLAPDPEYLADSTLQDRAIVLWSYANQAEPESNKRILSVLHRLGFRTRGERLRLSEDLGYRALAASSSRLRGCMDLLAIEHRARGDGLRALILTDRDTEGGPLSAREVLKGLLTRSDTECLDPILVTGSVFWVDEDIWPRLKPLLPALPWQRVDEHYEVDVSGWSSGERVALATRLLSEGVSRCLVGTRHLLGEGWDCPPVNCAVDLTGIVASVTVNQVRGRALRNDPNDASKVASIWEVVTLAPGLPGGERMLEKLLERHTHTFGIDDQGRIRRGRDRLDVGLLGSASEVATRIDEIRERMTERALDNPKTKELWNVGQSYLNRQTWRVEGLGPRRSRPVRTKLEKPLAPSFSAIKIRRRRWRVGAVAGMLAASGVVFVQPWLGMALFVAGVGMGWRSSRLPIEQARIRAVFHGLVEAELVEGELCFQDSRAWLEGPSKSSHQFAQSVAELLGPFRHPRYLLIESDGSPWPVPALLGADRSLADDFGRVWAREIGPCEVLYARQGRGRELLRAAWSAGSTGSVELMEEWE